MRTGGLPALYARQVAAGPTDRVAEDTRLRDYLARLSSRTTPSVKREVFVPSCNDEVPETR